MEMQARPMPSPSSNLSAPHSARCSPPHTPQGTLMRNFSPSKSICSSLLPHSHCTIAPEAFTDTVIMYEVLSELKEIAARPRGITCACGSERYRMQVRPAAVDLICEDCGAKLRIGAATDEDLDLLCCRMTLQIPGKKG